MLLISMLENLKISLTFKDKNRVKYFTISMHSVRIILSSFFFSSFVLRIFCDKRFSYLKWVVIVLVFLYVYIITNKVYLLTDHFSCKILSQKGREGGEKNMKLTFTLILTDLISIQIVQIQKYCGCMMAHTNKATKTKVKGRKFTKKMDEVEVGRICKLNYKMNQQVDNSCLHLCVCFSFQFFFILLDRNREAKKTYKRSERHLHFELEGFSAHAFFTFCL